MVELCKGPLEVEAPCVDGVGVEVELFTVVATGVVEEDGVVEVVGPRLEVVAAVVDAAEVLIPGF